MCGRVFAHAPADVAEIEAAVEQDEIGTIESVKAVAEIYTPLAGEVVEINEALKDDPELVNEDPHADGWLVKIKFSASSDFDDLMDAEAYAEFADQGKH
jgi:glycine cleavage system H protein